MIWNPKKIRAYHKRARSKYYGRGILRLDVDARTRAPLPVPVHYDEFARTHDDPVPVPVASKPPAISRAPQSLRDSSVAAQEAASVTTRQPQNKAAIVVTDRQRARKSAARCLE